MSDTPSDLTKLQANSTITERKHQPHDKGIHKLPPELLSVIFLMAEEMDRATRARESWYLAVQDVATQVCSRWRNVAVNSPVLWTHIHITRNSSHNLALLYLARAGDSVLLDIVVEIRPRYYCDFDLVEGEDWEMQRYLVAELCAFLSLNKAPVNRWKSLSVSAIIPDVLLEFIETICVKTAPNLRFLSCRWLCDYFDRADEQRIRDEVPLPGKVHRLSPLVVPVLRSVEFDHLLWDYIFDRPLSTLSGLTELRLTFSLDLCLPSQLANLLASNPQLELLMLAASIVSQLHAITDDLILVRERAHMAKLHTLSINTISDLSWALVVLQIVDAPALKKLSISSFISSRNKDVRITELCKASNRSSLSDNPTTSQYPLVDELDIHNCLLHRQQIVDMFVCWPSITRLYANRGQVDLLKEEPSLLPCLSYLKIDFKPHPQLGAILNSREAAGFPVKVVDLPRNRWQDEVEDEIPNTVTIREHDADEIEVDNDDSMTEAGSWVTEDSDSDWSNPDSTEDESIEPRGEEWIWGVHL
ncbi:unnamed protein product [Rhizoctonia solani]|uniref:F-box domain-containing protein n=1 Tax=Rhizoctonia solani TaxID=456999 RepID=A0A8H3B2U6_9AGAM|nr:unnamed protein product [Rhizoctonia solani]